MAFTSLCYYRIETDYSMAVNVEYIDFGLLSISLRIDSPFRHTQWSTFYLKSDQPYSDVQHFEMHLD